MRTPKKLLIGLALVVVSSGVAIAGATVEVFKTKGKSALASFATADNCENSFTNINYIESVSKTNGNKVVEQPVLFVEVDYADGCHGEHILMTGITNTVQAQIKTDISSGKIIANVPVADETGTKTATIYVNLDFKGTGTITKVSNKTKSKEGNVVRKFNVTIEGRPATATGTISGIIPFAVGPGFRNMTQGPSLSASLGKTITGDMTITKKH